MRCRRVERGVAVVLRGPSGDVAVIDDLDLTTMRMTCPHEGTALAGLAPAVEFGSVVRDRRPEVGAPCALAVIAVGTRVRQDVDARVPDLDGQGVRVSV